MTNTNTYKPIFELIQQTIDLINSEYEAIREHNLELMDELTKKKEDLFSEILKQQAKITEMLTDFPEQKEPFGQLVEQLQQLSNRNSRVIQGYLNQLNKVLNIMYGKDDVCYGKKG